MSWSGEDEDSGENGLFKNFELITVFDYYAKVVAELKKTAVIWETVEKREWAGEDLGKAVRRRDEFRARFARNYLYPLFTQVRAVKKAKTSEELLKCLTKAYQAAAAASTVFNGFISASENLPIIGKLKEFVEEVRRLREMSRETLRPIEETLATDSDLMEALCGGLLTALQKKTGKPKRKKKEQILPIKPSELDMYQPTISLWPSKSAILAKFKVRREPVKPQESTERETKKNVQNIVQQPVEMDFDVETAVCTYDTTEEILQPKIEPTESKTSNVAFFTFTSNVPEEIPEEPPKISPVMKKKRFLKIPPEILDEFFRFKIQISDAEFDSNLQACLTAQLTESIFDDIIGEIATKLTHDAFLDGIISLELSDINI